MAVSDLITSIRYVISDQNSTNFADAEILDYINRGYDLIYQRLIQLKSDLVLSKDTDTLVSGTESYTLPADFMALESFIISTGESPLKQVDMPYIETYADRFTPYSNDTPTCFALYGGSYYVRPIPDSGYTLYLYYYPTLTELTTASTAPFNGIFNHAMKAYAEAMCLNRDEFDVKTEQAAMTAIIRSADLVARRRNKGLRRAVAYRWEYEGLIY